MKKILFYIISISLFSLILFGCNFNKDNWLVYDYFKYQVVEDKVQITDVVRSNYKMEVEVPSQIDGMDVISIGPYAFSETSITKITIPDTVEEIGMRAFWACRKIEEIVIPRTVKYVGEYTFESCDSLTNIYIYSKIVPSLWSENWNTYCEANVVLNYSGSGTYITSIDDFFTYVIDNKNFKLVVDKKIGDVTTSKIISFTDTLCIVLENEIETEYTNVDLIKNEYFSSFSKTDFNENLELTSNKETYLSNFSTDDSDAYQIVLSIDLSDSKTPVVNISYKMINNTTLDEKDIVLTYTISNINQIDLTKNGE